MIEDTVVVVLIVFLFWHYEWLDPFRNATGRLILVAFVIYLAQNNIVVAAFATLLLFRVMDNLPVQSISLGTPLDLMRIGNMMRPVDSNDSPSAWLTSVPGSVWNYEI